MICIHLVITIASTAELFASKFHLLDLVMTISQRCIQRCSTSELLLPLVTTASTNELFSSTNDYYFHSFSHWAIFFHQLLLLIYFHCFSYWAIEHKLALWPYYSLTSELSALSFPSNSQSIAMLTIYGGLHLCFTFSHVCMEKCFQHCPSLKQWLKTWGCRIQG